ncbi:PHP domain-containing protein [Roseimaritima ulvae]|uniref:PHP domain protein n=1 Tax=Roseimaritima ulvae TaxID=980254 RepID=A0A5B9QUL5_9BACT|nr:hypothetical protein [Roseimaritima ulvae]QEG41460.1 hypothetical protein UC8_34820 [Roseimaritima ulvae]
MNKSRSFCYALLVLLHCGFAAATATAEDTSPPLRWWKGNLHTHSLWSDGDEFPEMIADWYRQRDYNFLALTDHNVLAEGQRWMSLKKIIARSDEGILDRYRLRFGDAWVQTRGTPGSDDYAVRLMPLDEFRSQLEQRNQFILIPAEEISDRAEGKPVHINATNIAEVIPPAGGATVREAMQNNLRAILEHERSHGRQVLPHINHPNFGYAITADDLAAVVSERFFEVYNGHPGVNHLGDKDHLSIERMWDVANAIRRTHLNVPPLMGIATDDSHEYHGKPGSRPGRGWVMVRSRYLSPEHLILALKAGDFYASSGVSLRDVGFDTQTQTLSLAVQPISGETYTTQFIASLKPEHEHPHDEDDDHLHLDEKRIGVVVATVEGETASYQMKGNELYVRAVVTSTAAAADPSFKDQKQQAWTQPVGWQTKESPSSP